MIHAFVHESGSELHATSFTRATIVSSTADTNLDKELLDTNGIVYEGKYKSSSHLNEHFTTRASHSLPTLTSTENENLLKRKKAANHELENGNNHILISIWHSNPDLRSYCHFAMFNLTANYKAKPVLLLGRWSRVTFGECGRQSMNN